MKVAIVPNAFKGSLTAAEAAACIERGLRKALRGLCRVVFKTGKECANKTGQRLEDWDVK